MSLIRQIYVMDEDGNRVGVQTPFATDGDSVYKKDIWVSQSNIGNFTGQITDLFDDLHTTITDSTSSNPKEILIHFKRTIVTNAVGLGAFTGNYSNVEIQIGNSGGVFTTLVDESASSTKYTSRTYLLPTTAGVNALKIKFHTTDTITLSNLVVIKSLSVFARLQGTRDDGTVADVIISNSNRLRTVSQPYEYALAEGDLSGHYSLLKFGTRTSVAAATPSLIWEGPTALYPYMSTAQQLQIASSAATDIAGGTGIRTLIIQGLDASYNEVSETITMNGTTQVTTVNSYIRIFRAYGETCGTSYTNDGTITIYDNAGTTVQGIINPGDGQTLMTMWTVPAGKTAFLSRGSVSTNSNKGARVSLFIRKIDSGTLYPWRIQYRGYLFSGGEAIDIKTPIALPEKTDIEIRINTPASAGTTSCGATFELWYEDN